MSEAVAEPRTPRGVVLARVAERATRFPDLPLDPLDVSGFASRDAALAHAIDHAIARRWLTLVAILESRLDRTWSRVEAPLQSALLVGAAQLIFLDRIPDHAAVDECVTWTKARRGPRAAGFVNAVLRKVSLLRRETEPADPASFENARDLVPLANGSAIRLSEDIFAEDRIARLAQVGSVGRELLLHWISAHGFAMAVGLVRHSLAEAPLLVTGLSGEASRRPDVRAHAEAGWFVFEGDHAALHELLANEPHARVQDPASGDAVGATRELSPRVAVDFCAGRGTKTVQLAAAFPEATIVANEPDARRREDLVQVQRRHANVRVITPQQLPEWFARADLVVLDVPCSNTAVLPRRPEAAYRFTAGRLERLVRTQRDIATAAMPLLAPSAHVVYATCSLEPAENARQSDAIRKRFRFVSRGERQRFPSGEPGGPAERYSDGGFWSLMRRG